MKKNRQEKLLEIISRYEVDTQEELIRYLQEAGYDVTQATVSRDIRELKIVKMNTGRGSYRYSLPKQGANGAGVKFNTALVDSIVNVEYANNLLVLKTYPGLAQAVASGIDRTEIRQILGCVAGDDTILVVTKDNESAQVLSNQIHELLRSI